MNTFATFTSCWGRSEYNNTWCACQLGVVRRYDNATTCGLVWTANFVAYRCRTCGISPCMSLCAQCFQEGDHEGHDFNMFRSQAGGACELWQLCRHEGNGEYFSAFIQHCREHSAESLERQLLAMDEAALFLDLLQDLSRLGAAMRHIMTKSLCNPKNTWLTVRDYMKEALKSIPFGEVPPGYEDVATLNGPLVHKNFLDEIVFWTVKFEFPRDKLVNSHHVVNCGEHVMRNHCYWPLVSDLNNVLSHKPIAVKFMSDARLIQEWFSFLSMFQGMNVNVRELSQHVEFEPQTECLRALSSWFKSVGFSHTDLVSFHLPLHRYYSVLMCQAVKSQGARLEEVLPPHDLLHLIMVHPLRLQVGHEDSQLRLPSMRSWSGMWVRNGLQIKGQAMTYIQCHFCNSMVDADLYLLQICAAELPPDNFVLTVLDRFHVLESLSISPRATNSFLDAEHEMTILESCLTFLPH
ncbi:hypothetical protein Pcinc_021134 [Petrolisthes cinctipes]|uniref:E3 ubiquitin-protein ligase n=1 Tax=Petrolisthes cinctipes TaxID=88211 RepID=A0AAE1KIU5_PETCI|nr:hypothetical protein Pcinc_021134 [Petrolisthes cinctipes]